MSVIYLEFLNKITFWLAFVYFIQDSCLEWMDADSWSHLEQILLSAQKQIFQRPQVCL